jgi:hypothetical protein
VRIGKHFLPPGVSEKVTVSRGVRGIFLGIDEDDGLFWILETAVSWGSLD